MKVISLDCETNGLGGLAFAAAAVLTDDVGQAAVWTGRCPIVGEVDEWVARNVLPAITDMPETVAAYEDLLTGWRDWYAQVRAAWPDVRVIGHVVWPVEARFLWDAHQGDLFAAPYPLLDVAGALDHAGCDPTSVDKYLDAHDLPRPPGSPHHPLYDACATVTAYRHLMNRERDNDT